MNLIRMPLATVFNDSLAENLFNKTDSSSFDTAALVISGISVSEVKIQQIAEFTDKAHKAGICPALWMDTRIAPERDIPLTEAQYNRDNTPERIEGHRFYVSPASRIWQTWLQETLRLFVAELGYCILIITAPVWRCDIPGTKDQFSQVFQDRHPEWGLPISGTDSAAYRLVQELKTSLSGQLINTLVEQARKSGATFIGIETPGLIPCSENTPPETLNNSWSPLTAANTAGVDFIISALNAEKLKDGLFRTADELTASPALAYVDSISTGSALPVILSISGDPQDDICRKTIIAGLAGGATGITLEPNSELTSFVRQTISLSGRLGQPLSQAAFVFSGSSARHGAPYPYHQIFLRWWPFAREMMLDKLTPTLTLFAENLENGLQSNPQLRLLILSSAFPLTGDQMLMIEKWLSEFPGRGLVVFEDSPQLSADPTRPGHVPLSESLPGLHRLLGLPWPEALNDTSGRMLLAMDPDAAESFAKALGLSSDIAPIQKLKQEDTTQPLKNRSGKAGATIAVLPFGPIDHPSGICRMVRGIARHCGAQAPIVREAHTSVLWSESANGYLTLSNLSKEPSMAALRTDGAALWDVRQRKMIKANPRIRISPLGFRLLRLLKDCDPILDISGQMWLGRIERTDDQTLVDAASVKNISIFSTVKPKRVAIRGTNWKHFSEMNPTGEYWVTVVEIKQAGKHRIEIAW